MLSFYNVFEKYFSNSFNNNKKTKTLTIMKIGNKNFGLIEGFRLLKKQNPVRSCHPKEWDDSICISFFFFFGNFILFFILEINFQNIQYILETNC